MLASVLAMLIAICFTYGVLAFYIQYSAPERIIVLWFIIILILAALQITNFLAPYITKILP